MRSLRTGLAILAAGLLLSAPAAAAKQYAPPGKAGTSEYAEDIPAAGGNVSTPAMGGGNSTAAQINKLGAGKVGVRKLAKLGKTGAAAAQFAEQTAPTTTSKASVSPAGAGGHSVGSHGTTVHFTVLTAPGGSALGGLRHLVSGSDVDGIGLLLPVLFAFGLGWVAAVAFLRTRRRADAGAPGL